MASPLLARPGASPLAAGATIPLTFIAAGVIAGAIDSAWLVVSPDLLTLPHLHPHVVAFAHLWLLGSLLTICFGAVYQLLPVLANTVFTGRGLAWTHLLLHTAGAITMVIAFRSGQMGAVALGGISVSAGVGLFAVNVARTLRAANRLDPVLVAFGCATAWLVVTVLAGVALAANLRFGWWGVDVLAVLRAHAHAGVAGFFITLLQGAMFRLVPMFTLAQAGNLQRVGVALALSQAGLLVLVTALALGSGPAELAGAALLAASFALSGFELRRVFAARRKRTIEPGLLGFFAGLWCLVLALTSGLGLALFGGDLRAALAYGTLAVLGGVLASVQGMLCKIVPFLVWTRVYGPRVGRQPTPQAAALGRASLERAWVWLHVVGSIMLAVGAWTGRESLLAGGAVVFVVGQGALLTSLACVAKHLWRPVGIAAPAVSFVKGLA